MEPGLYKQQYQLCGPLSSAGVSRLAVRATSMEELYHEAFDISMGRMRRYVLIFLLILKEPNMPEADCRSKCKPSSCICTRMGLTRIPQDLPTSISELDSNNITDIQSSAFSNLPKLLELRLEANRISVLPPSASDILASISIVHIEGNPWQCDYLVCKDYDQLESGNNSITPHWLNSTTSRPNIHHSHNIFYNKRHSTKEQTGLQSPITESNTNTTLVTSGHNNQYENDDQHNPTDHNRQYENDDEHNPNDQDHQYENDDEHNPNDQDHKYENNDDNNPNDQAHQYENNDQQDPRGQGQSQAITGSNTDTTYIISTVVTSDHDPEYEIMKTQHDQTDQGISQATTYYNESLGTRNVMYTTETGASAPNPVYTCENDQTGQN
ncbi:hypothetical protein Bbelb_415210 [Branchiostoma belcheri]|nr:hypothetical protein Bbelb_415210 [Branchiostoma belcheri]